MKPAKLFTVLTLSGVCLGSLPFALGRCGVLLNCSDSVHGLVFLRTSNPAAPYIVFCAPAPADPAILRTAFEGMPAGQCRGGYPPLLKPFVKATQDHPLGYSAHGFTVDGKLLRNTAPKPVSRQGLPLTHYPFGVYTSGLWPVSVDSPDSYDARYFGPIDPAIIRFHAIALAEFRK